MNKPLFRPLVAAIALLFVVAACAGDTGAAWTFAPVTVAVADVSDSEEATEKTVVDVEAGDTAETDGVEGAAAGDARVIDVVSTAALQFTTVDGVQLTDIAVTPGETVVFRVENTAGFPHNFYVGDPSELSVAAATTDTGIPDWSTGVEELEWVVPDDVSGIQFACTVPGHYSLMNGTFTATEGAPEAPPADGDEGAAAGEGRVIDVVSTAALQFTTVDGVQLTDIAVTPGETVVFRVENTAGFPHNFYVGKASEVSVPAAMTDSGIADWSTGVQELQWVVPDDVSNLQFACTVPGHYSLMQGTFSVSS